MKKAIIYCRAKQRDRVSAQRRSCLAYCRRRGVSVKRVFVDQGERAALGDQPALKQLVRFCRTNKNRINAVVVQSPDRLSRWIPDLLKLTTRLNLIGVMIRTVGGDVEPVPHMELVDSLLTAVAEYEQQHSHSEHRKKLPGVGICADEK